MEYEFGLTQLKRSLKQNDNKDSTLSISDLYPSLSQKIIKRSNYRISGKYPSMKMHRMIPWSKEGSRYLFYIMDTTPSINAFWEYPAEFTLNAKNINIAIYPDVLYQQDNKYGFIHVVDTPRLSQTLENKTALNELLRHFSNSGIRFHQVDLPSLRKSNQLANASILLRYGRGSINKIDINEARSRFNQFDQITWGEVVKLGYGRSSLQIVCWLIIKGYLSYPANERITNRTIIRWMDHEQSNVRKAQDGDLPY